MASKYQKRHYEDVATIFKVQPDGCIDCRCETFLLLAESFAGMFAVDNPLFNRERFLKACGLEDA